MSGLGPDREPDWVRHLQQAPRENPPEIPLEGLIDRAVSGHRRPVLVAAVALAAALFLGLLLQPGVEPPPVHLDLRIVDEDALYQDGQERAVAPESDAGAFDRP